MTPGAGDGEEDDRAAGKPAGPRFTRRSLLVSAAAAGAGGMAAAAARTANDPEVKERFAALQRAHEKHVRRVMEIDNEALQAEVKASRPLIFRRFAEMAAAAGLGDVELYISEAPETNAYSKGRTLDDLVLIASKKVAITRELLDLLDDREVVAIIGHELGHQLHGSKQRMYEWLGDNAVALAAWPAAAHVLHDRGAGPPAGGRKPGRFTRRSLLEYAVACGVVASVAPPVIDPPGLKRTIKHLGEFRADDEAVNLSGDREAFVSAMMKLGRRGSGRGLIQDSDTHPSIRRRIGRQMGR